MDRRKTTAAKKKPPFQLRVRTAIAARLTRRRHRELAADKTYLTVHQLSGKLDADESEIHSAIRFGALKVERFPVRGALRFRIEEGIARAFAAKFYARTI